LKLDGVPKGVKKRSLYGGVAESYKPAYMILSWEDLLLRMMLLQIGTILKI
jgi:hypothetical protein